jgi:hypothetical protein
MIRTQVKHFWQEYHSDGVPSRYHIKRHKSQAWWCTVVPALRRLRQENLEFEDCIARPYISCPSSFTLQI